MKILRDDFKMRCTRPLGAMREGKSSRPCDSGFVCLVGRASGLRECTLVCVPGASLWILAGACPFKAIKRGVSEESWRDVSSWPVAERRSKTVRSDGVTRPRSSNHLESEGNAFEPP